ncbi:hypothetical protein N4T77_06080 [Clostridium sp. CX1]|uniref:hypothetical protein n=1 Tax=Clostridium sp. CX1 TaxID=2978346 RepID=UPI0021C103C1|nr:hypothetical protein [Clostridium sp. CX1]MCT8976162.1 hypothetical protein [Clostridium sp. CX1]
MLKNQSRTGLNKIRIDTLMELGEDMNTEYKDNLTYNTNSSTIIKMIAEYERNLIGK